jgi:DNA-binding NarL/FixJ family response regulator
MVLPVAEDKPLTCLVVADHQLCGQALGGLLSEQCGLELQAVCASVAEALGVMEHSAAPELLLLDLGRASDHWQEVAAALQRRNPDGRLIMLSGRQEPRRSPEPMTAIVLGVVDKGGPWDDLITLVSRWQQQHPSPAVRRSIMALEQLDRLSPRERRVFHCLGKGMQSKEIARSLGLCVNTVDTYRKTISGKLGLSGAELVRAAALQRCTNRLGD